MCDFDSASAAKRPVLLVMSRSVTCRISTISVRATTRGSTLHTQISSLRQQRGQCPLKSCGVVERMGLGSLLSGGARSCAGGGGELLELALQRLGIDRAFVHVERGRIRAVERLLAHAQASADHEHNLAREALLHELDAAPDCGAIPEAEHLAQDELARALVREAQIRHAQADAWQLQHLLGEVGTKSFVLPEGIEQCLDVIARRAR